MDPSRAIVPIVWLPSSTEKKLEQLFLPVFLPAVQLISFVSFSFPRPFPMFRYQFWQDFEVPFGNPEVPVPLLKVVCPYLPEMEERVTRRVCERSRFPCFFFLQSP